MRDSLRSADECTLQDAPLAGRCPCNDCPFTVTVAGHSHLVQELTPWR